MLFERYPKEDRIIIPLLEVMDLLFGVGVWQKLVQSKQYGDELSEMLVNARKEVLKCRDVRKVLSAIKVYVIHGGSMFHLVSFFI